MTKIVQNYNIDTIEGFYLVPRTVEKIPNLIVFIISVMDKILILDWVNVLTKTEECKNRP